VIPCQVNRLWMPQRERGADVAPGRPQGISFSSLFWASNTLWGSLDRWDFASTFVIPTQIMQSVPQAQSPCTKIFLKRRSTAGLSCFSGLDFESTERLVWIIGSSRTAEGKGLGSKVAQLISNLIVP
jgi:hypothetical protein